MVRLPGGTFRMGSDKESLLGEFPTAGPGLKSMLFAETPAHEVTLPPFRMDRVEVTNARFRDFVRARPQWRKGEKGGNYLLHWTAGDQYPDGQDDFPVAFITWNAAVAYAEWAGKRLPTEAEWEFAARGGRSGAKYPWGDDDPSPRLAHYSGSVPKGPRPVGATTPNPYGLYDLAGNVWEFCLDEWNSYPSHAVVQSPADLSGMRQSKAERRVIRGGSFDGGAFNMRVTARDSHRVDDPVAHVGFRCAHSGAG